MMKEAALFTVSTGVLIYFISPVAEQDKAAPQKVEKVETVKPPVESEDDSWDYGDEEAGDEDDFVFGEPMDQEEDDDEEYDEESGDAASSDGESRGVEFAKNTNASNAHPDSPKNSERGSRENPIVFETNNPANAEDD